MTKDGTDSELTDDVTPRDNQHDSATSPGDDCSAPAEDVVRTTVGSSMHTLTDLVNDNLIAFRYATGSAVLLLGLYSISQTPLFFRYKSVLKLPSTIFSKRQTLTCRLYNAKNATKGGEQSVGSDSSRGQPLVVHVRHLSPMGRLLSKKQLDYTVEHMSPSTVRHGNKSKADDDDTSDNTLLRIQLYGLVQDPSTRTSSASNNLLTRLVRDHALVRCQFISLLPSSDNDSNPATAIARLYYWKRRQSSLLWFLPQKVDLQGALVQAGEARVGDVDNDDLLQQEDDNDQQTARHKFLHASESVNDKLRDVQYLDQLVALERDAIQHHRGMWQSQTLRDAHIDVVEEIEWEASAKWYQKLWRRVFRSD